jgi:hypothetical protein
MQVWLIVIVQVPLLGFTCIPHEVSPYWLKGIARSWRSGSPSPPLRIVGGVYATVACCVGKFKSLLLKCTAALSFVNASAYRGGCQRGGYIFKGGQSLGIRSSMTEAAHR